MKTLPIWLPPILQIIGTLFVILNQWLLELFKLKMQSDEERLKSDQGSDEKQYEKGKRKRNFISFVLVLTLICYSIYRVAVLLICPSNNPNWDAFSISFNVGMIFFMILISIIYKLIEISRWHLKLTKELFDSQAELAKNSSILAKGTTAFAESATDLAKNTTKLLLKNKLNQPSSKNTRKGGKN